MSEIHRGVDGEPKEPILRRTLIRIVQAPEGDSNIATICIPAWSSDDFEYPIDLETLRASGLRVENGARFLGYINLGATSQDELNLLPTNYEVRGDGFLSEEDIVRWEARGL